MALEGLNSGVLNYNRNVGEKPSKLTIKNSTQSIVYYYLWTLFMISGLIFSAPKCFCANSKENK